jgi:hypothetical protein
MIRITIQSDRGEGATTTAIMLAKLLRKMGMNVHYTSIFPEKPGVGLDTLCLLQTSCEQLVNRSIESPEWEKINQFTDVRDYEIMDICDLSKPRTRDA